MNRYSRPMIQQPHIQVLDTTSQQLVEEFLLHERELSLETDTNKNFFEAWEKESESTLIFLQENGQAISAGNGITLKMRIDMIKSLKKDQRSRLYRRSRKNFLLRRSFPTFFVKNGYNIGKLVRLDYDQKPVHLPFKKDGYLVAIPCQLNTRSMEKLIRSNWNCV